MNRLTLNLNQALRTLSFAGAAAFALTGCMTSEEKADYNSDGQSAYMTSEVDQMGQVYDQIGSGAAGKESGLGAGLTITGELVIEPFAYHADCACFVRKAEYTGMKGYERVRLDSVKLYDSAGNTMDKFYPAQVAKIVHSRNVTKTLGAREADIRMDFTVDIKTEGGVKKGVWNGTMSGSYNGQPFKSATMTNVVRVWENGRFHFPESGTIELDRPVFHFLAEFMGDGKAKITVTNKVNHKIHVIFVDANYNETEPAEQP